jgi:enediyne biosynthesis protein E4
MNRENPSVVGVEEIPRVPASAKHAVVPPLLRVVLPLVITAIVLSVMFAKWFPAPSGTRPPPAVRFTNVTAEAGLDFRHFAGAGESRTTLGAGVAVLDFDGDGDADLFFVNGTAWPWEESMTKRAGGPTCALYRNDGEGKFTDVTARAGLNVELQGMTAAAGDFDGDGLVDLFVTCVGTNHLFHNRGDGRFEDITEEAGVGGDDHTWSTSAVWIDYDRDARLDLVVAHYAHWPEEVGLATAFAVAGAGRSYGAPTGFVSAFPSVYRNLGGGRFARVAGSAGLRDVDPQTGLPVAKPLAVVPVDANGDGRLDLFFTYHTSPAALFLNRDDVTFRKWAGERGERPEGATAGIPSGLAQVASLDERVAALEAALNWLKADGDARGVYLPAKLGVAVGDFDGDGRAEIFSGEGRAERDVNQLEEQRRFGAAPKLLWQDGAGWRGLADVDQRETIAPGVARGIATGDFDGDGDLDVVVAQHGGAPLLLRNEQRAGLPWLRVKLVGTRSGADAGGARVQVHTPRRVMTQTWLPAMGLLAQSESVLTFGLGEDARVRRVVVIWPSGQRQELRAPGINRVLVVREP